MFIRSARLSGKAGPLIELTTLLSPGHYIEDSETGARVYPALSDLRFAVTLSAVAGKLGYPNDALRNRYAQHLKNAEGVNAVEAAEAEADSLFAAMETMRSDLGLSPLGDDGRVQ